MSDTHLTEVAFTNLHLPEALARGIADAGFERCTPIQAQTLPKALAGFDVAGQAQRALARPPRSSSRSSQRCCAVTCRRRGASTRLVR